MEGNSTVASAAPNLQQEVVSRLLKLDESSALKLLGIVADEAFVRSSSLACNPWSNHCRGCYNCYGGCSYP